MRRSGGGLAAPVARRCPRPSTTSTAMRCTTVGRTHKPARKASGGGRPNGRHSDRCARGAGEVRRGPLGVDRPVTPEPGRRSHAVRAVGSRTPPATSASARASGPQRPHWSRCTVSCSRGGIGVGCHHDRWTDVCGCLIQSAGGLHSGHVTAMVSITRFRCSGAGRDGAGRCPPARRSPPRSRCPRRSATRRHVRRPGRPWSAMAGRSGICRTR